MIFYDHIDEMTLFNDAMEASGMAWWLFEHPSGLIFYNHNKLKMLGFEAKDAEEFVHLSKFAELLHPEDMPKVTKALMDCVEGKTDFYQSKYRMKTKSGTYKQFLDRGKVVIHKADGQVSVAGFAMDLTDMELNQALN